MKKIVLICLTVLLACNIRAQSDVDSLVNILETQKLTHKEQLDIYRKLCVFFGNSDLSKLMEYSQKGLILAEKENDIHSLSLFNELTGFYYETNFKNDSAIIFYEKALALAIRSNDMEREGQVYLSFGALYFQQKQYVLALDYFMNALRISENMENKSSSIYPLGNIGTIHVNMKNYDKAIYYFEQALTLAEELQYNRLKINPNYYLGIIYQEKKDFDKALKYTQNALDISRYLHLKSSISAALQSMAQIYLTKDQPDYELSMQYAVESLKIAEESGYLMMVSGALKTISNIYKEQNQWKLCEEWASKAWENDSVDIGSDVENNVIANIVLANIHLGNKEKAEKFFNKFNDIMLKQSDKNLHNSLSEMEVKYETEKKEIKIAALEQEKTLYTWIIIISVVAALLAFIILFYRHKLNLQKRKQAEQEREIAEQKIKQLEQEKQLVASQAIIEGEVAERSRLARDLHDGLGGMLSVIKMNLKDMHGYSALDNFDIDHFNNAMNMLDQSIDELRRVAHHIMPESLMRYGLKVSLEDFCRAIHSAHFCFFGDDTGLDNSLKILIYRCAYELINNAVKHANAANINVQLVIENGLIALSVHDDGTGFDPEKVKKGSGLENVRMRVATYNGKMNIYSLPRKGTEISIEIES
ncbi:MAG: sensor histidine kinase [Prevotellaceae bacterium]|jgi:signal transduction histidine kinase/Tfp pilus assembly protein PilF|nr:sensor histidine kinase [Prevotellaceae bacterium]